MRDQDFLKPFESLMSAAEARTLITAVSLHDRFYAREEAVKRYGFSIPCKEAVEAVAALSPLVEVGAGSGYWSRFLRAAGADVVTTDVGGQPKYSRLWNTEGIDVLEAVEAIKRHSDRNVFMSWPSYGKSWAANVASEMQSGRYLVYIGESKGGCTADVRFFDVLASEFDKVGFEVIPRWENIHDYLTIYKKR